jgi:hypothetical protein
MTGIEGFDIDLLTGDWFELPRPWPGGNILDFTAFLEQQFESFNRKLHGFHGQLAGHLVERRKQLLALESSIIGALRALARAESDRALRTLSQGLGAVRPEIAYISECNDRILSTQTTSLYRLRKWNDQTGGEPQPRDLFHVPFDLAHIAEPARFSVKNAPCLYLGNSIGLCWVECREPDFAKCYVARFELAKEARKVLDLSCGPGQVRQDFETIALTSHLGLSIQPSQLTNGPYGNDPACYLACYFILWPLMAASLIRKDELRDPQPEYAIPQLLMSWAQQSDNDYCGVRFFSTRDEPPTSSVDYRVNYAFPARERSANNYCGFLTKYITLTQPVRSQRARLANYPELLTSAASVRESRHGRLAMRSQPYLDTEYCYLEYLLDTMPAKALEL